MDMDIALIATSRSRKVLSEIVAGDHLRMSCGDVRIATTLKDRGLISITNPGKREFTSSYRPTQRGLDALAHYERP
jgi:hypothetical protein